VVAKERQFGKYGIFLKGFLMNAGLFAYLSG
jgi:hypothetical protein